MKTNSQMSKQYQKQKEKWKKQGYQLAKKEIIEKIEKKIDEWCSNKYGASDMKIFDLEVREELKSLLEGLWKQAEKKGAKN